MPKMLAIPLAMALLLSMSPGMAAEQGEGPFLEGTTRAIMQRGIHYDVSLVGAQDPDTLVIRINDRLIKVDEGKKRRAYGLGIYVARVTYLPKDRQASFAKLIFF